MSAHISQSCASFHVLYKKKSGLIRLIDKILSEQFFHPLYTKTDHCAVRPLLEGDDYKRYLILFSEILRVQPLLEVDNY